MIEASCLTAEVYVLSFETTFGTPRVYVGYKELWSADSALSPAELRFEQQRGGGEAAAVWCRAGVKDTFRLIQVYGVDPGVHGRLRELQETLDCGRLFGWSRTRGAFACEISLSLCVLEELEWLMALETGGQLTDDWVFNLAADTEDFPLTYLHLHNKCFFCKQDGHSVRSYAAASAAK